jgi:type IV pilus assembly protein PilN
MIRINLLPIRELKKQAQLRQQLYVCGAIAGVVMISVSLVWLMDIRAIGRLEKEKATLQAELERLKPIVTEVNALEQREKLLQTRIGTIHRLRSNQRGPVHVLDELSQNLPEQAWLEAVDENAGVYKVAGYALTNFAVADLLRNLQRSKEFTNVDLVSSEQTVMATQAIKKFIIQFQRAATKASEPESTPPTAQRKPGA